jgi:hypothetical protein
VPFITFARIQVKVPIRKDERYKILPNMPCRTQSNTARIHTYVVTNCGAKEMLERFKSAIPTLTLQKKHQIKNCTGCSCGGCDVYFFSACIVTGLASWPCSSMNQLISLFNRCLC